MHAPDGKPLCDMDINCRDKPIMIGSSGFIYCAYHGPRRRASGYERVRKMTPAELRLIAAGQPIKEY